MSSEAKKPFVLRAEVDRKRFKAEMKEHTMKKKKEEEGQQQQHQLPLNTPEQKLEIMGLDLAAVDASPY